MSSKAFFAGEWNADVLAILNADNTAIRPCYIAPTTKGARVHSITVSNSDSTARVVQMWYGRGRTLQTAATSLVITGTNTITRGSGDFRLDGWRVGALLIVYDPTAASHLVNGVVSAVTQTALTVAGLTNETLSSNCRLFQLASQTAWSIPITAGYANAVPSVALLDVNKNGSIDASPGRFITVGKCDGLFFNTATQVTAPNKVEITVHGGDYEQNA